ncbi:MAG: hypothetical protein M1833_005492 [Piccolia ochrophora]|nr:MAG: hypothetical protein M1833_005492 [Piccolia ochrophora]
MAPARTQMFSAGVNEGSSKACRKDVANVVHSRSPEMNGTRHAHEGILDIRREGVQGSVHAQILEKLRPEDGAEKGMPTLLLYDEVGLKLFEDITYLEEYYLTNAEIDVLSRHAEDIASRIRPGTMVVELGSGNLRKVNILLRALERAGKSVEYYALDLSLEELKRTLSKVPENSFKHVKLHGLHGTYDDGLIWLRSQENLNRPKCILSLGSSIGNFTRGEAARFLGQFSRILQEEDSMLIGLDGCKDKERVFRAYNDREGVTHRFLRNGLTHANEVLGKEVFNHNEWNTIGEYNAEKGCHEAFYSPTKDVQFDDVAIRAGERVRVEESYKYSPSERSSLWSKAGLCEDSQWGIDGNLYHLHMLKKRSSYPLDPAEYAAKPVPSLQEWTAIWAMWDTVTQGMVPQGELFSKPIKLRNACIFYLGHIPTFLDMHLTRATNEASTPPEHYPLIFERGIDPDVDNPERCHAHSEIPETWPSVDEILDFQERVRHRVRQLYKTDAVDYNHRLGRALWLTFEHEAMHLETFLYMLVQSKNTLPPPSSSRPDFAAMAHQARSNAVHNEWITIPTTTVSLGTEDPEGDSESTRYFGWDNEKPRRRVNVASFQSRARPITNGEYACYLEQTGKSNIPASWDEAPVTNGTASEHGDDAAWEATDKTMQTPSKAFLRGKTIKTIYGAVSLVLALDWPVAASYDELALCAKWMNGRIPTLQEARSIYSYAGRHKSREASHVLEKQISAVNGYGNPRTAKHAIANGCSHLSNDGVEETPPPSHWQSRRLQAEPPSNPLLHFASLEGCNVGFHNWHPVPVTPKGGVLCGQADLGGVWEWTSSVLEEHEGFKPMELYPGYSS